MLSKACSPGRQLLASPGSYNSQLGLPLAVLSAEKPEPLAILEVGISAPGEMAALEEIAAAQTTEFLPTSAWPTLPRSAPEKPSHAKR